MDTQSIINFAVGAFLAGLGWFARQLWEAVARLRADLHSLEVHVSTKYVPKDEFRQGIYEIKEMLAKIFDKLDGKVDKR